MRALFNTITSLSLRFRWITAIITVGILTGGYLAFSNLNQELLPDIEFPQTFIINQNSGASSDQLLTMYALPIEKGASAVPDVVNVETVSNDGFGFATIRNEFGVNQERVVADLQAMLDEIPLPVRRVVPAEGQTAADLIGELSPEAVLWLYTWATAENSGFIPQLTSETLRAFSPEALAALPEEAFRELAPDLRAEVTPAERADIQLAEGDIPALPASWQGDARFKTVEDLAELTTTRSLAAVFNNLMEDGHLVGPLGKTDDLTPADVELFLQFEAECRSMDRPERQDGSDACSFVGELDANTILALSDEILAVLPADYLQELSPIERNEIAAVRAAEALSGQKTERQSVLLPDSWRVEEPAVLTFSFSDIPLGAVSINSQVLSADELRTLVENELVPRLREANFVANVVVDGGEIIPIAIQNEARTQYGLPPLEANNGNAADEVVEPESASELPEGPALPPIWNAVAGIVGADEFDTADDILKLIGGDIQGVEITSAAGFINALAEQPTAAPLLDTLNQEIIDYLASQESSFLDDLSPTILARLQGEGEEESASELPEGPALPPIWNAVAGIVGADEFDTADDILKLIGGDIQGVEITSAADFINALAEQPTAAPLLDTLNQEIIDYLASQESSFLDDLSPAILNRFTSPALGQTWEQLAAQPLLAATPLKTAADLNAADAAETISTILVATDQAGLHGFAVRLMDDLSPEALTALVEANPNFLEELAATSPDALRYLSKAALETESIGDFIRQADNTELAAELQAIIDGEQPTAAETLGSEDTIELFIDPDAPALPASWIPVATFVGVTELDSTDDIFNVPGYAGAADLVSRFALGGGGQGLIRDMTLENWLYLAEIEEGFWENINASAIRLLNQDLVDITQLPPNIQARIEAGGEAYMPEATVTRTDFNPSLVLSIFKEDNANTVIGWENAAAVLEEFDARDDVTVNEIFEQASFITDSLDGVVREGTLGGIFAIIMILVFMNVSVRSTAVVAVSIPSSVMFAFVAIWLVPGNMYQLLAPIVDDVGRDTTLGGILTVVLRLFPENFTLNIMTLSGMTVAIGRVVDDSIVVLENIYRNISLAEDQSKASRRASILNGTREVSVAIFAATLTTMVVFLPLGLFGGVTGSFFLPFGLSITYALVGSFLAAITIVPVLADLFITRESMPEEGTIKITEQMSFAQKAWGRFANIFIGGVEWLGQKYEILIGWALRNRWIVVGAALLSLFFGLYLMGTRPVQFLPSLGEPTATITANLPAEFKGQPITVAQTNAKVNEFELWLMEQKEVNPDMNTVQVTVGSAGGFNFAPSGGITETAAAITVTFNTKEALDTFIPLAREKAELIFNDLDANGVLDYEENGDADDGVVRSNVTVSGADAAGGGFGGFALVLRGTDPEKQPSLSELSAYNEVIITALNEVEGLVNVELESAFGGEGVSYIRIDGVPALRYIGELETDDTIGTTQTALLKAQEAIDALHAADPELTVPVELSQGFESEQQAEGIAEIFVSMGIATLIAYVLLVITFNSFILPIEILVSLPLSIVGAAVALTLTNRVLGLPAMVGLLMLIGIVVTNAIVFLDRVQQNKREKNMATNAALQEAGRTRLRPILMTASTTAIAQLPLAASTESGAIIAAELGTVVIGGLVSSTVLTLVVLPVVYSLIDGGIRRLFGRKETPA